MADDRYVHAIMHLCTYKAQNDVQFMSNVVPQECTYFSRNDVLFLSKVVGEVNSFIERHILPTSTLESSILEMLLPLKSSEVFIVRTLLDVAAVLFDVAARVGLMKNDYIWIMTNNANFSLLHSSHAMQGVIAVKDYFSRGTSVESLK
ncbi:hypothetical protein MRB53_034190 [Persea americana]|uniref:Uncharacterized protein n=1 Tax=Persea americana TaxID=3435 RepID=A0ACC2KX50_PERAE|nr:hypothetical protein MRB53_034190 [Persea americana]